MTTVDELLAEDGTVRVPAHTAARLFNIVWRHCKAEQRDHGAALSPDMERLLLALHRAASGFTGAPISSEGSPVDGLEILGAHEVAEIIGCTRRTATSLLGSGRLRAWQVGRIWVTTRGDLDAHRYGREERSHGEGEGAGEVREGRDRAAEQQERSDVGA
jgi:hypothetical protein